MEMMVVLAAASLVLMYFGISLTKKNSKVGYVIIDLAINFFLIGILIFARKDLGVNIGVPGMIIYIAVISVIATINIVKSCKTSFKVGQMA